MDTIVYDIEIAKEVTQCKNGWKDPYAMGFASAVAYSYNLDKYFFFLHERSRNKLIQLLQNNIVVTFNGVKFDSKCLLGSNRKICNSSPDIISVSQNHIKWKEYDIFLAALKSRWKLKTVYEALSKMSDGGMNLNSIATKTLGLKKNGNGAEAPKLYQSGRFDELFEYNLNDVSLTKKLYDFICQRGFLKTENEKKRILKIKKPIYN